MMAVKTWTVKLLYALFMKALNGVVIYKDGNPGSNYNDSDSCLPWSHSLLTD
jgi:hypothetical protein